jgi:CPA2 family monovalent cation:H+ antiporter-2
LFGYQKGGHEFVRVFRQMKEDFIVVDYDPVIVEVLENKRIPHMYGDATDIELLNEVNVQSAKLIISTITDFETNQQLVKNTHHLNPHAIIIVSADSHEEAVKLYHLGCSYVMMPHFIGSEKISSFVKQSNLSRSTFKQFRDKHLKYLEKQLVTLEKKDAKHEKKLGHIIVDSMAALTKNRS